MWMSWMKTLTTWVVENEVKSSVENVVTVSYENESPLVGSGVMLSRENRVTQSAGYRVRIFC